MDPETYCREKVSPPGSGFYYSTLYLPANTRVALNAVHAFASEVIEISSNVSDPGVARLRLQWWREELARIYSGSSRHPIGKSLSQIITRFALREDAFLDIINGVECDLVTGRHDNFDSLKQHLSKINGNLWKICATINGYSDKQTLEYADMLGCGIGLTALIQELHEDALRGRLRFPQEDAQRLTVEDFCHPTDRPDVLRFIALQVNRAQTMLKEARELLPPVDRLRQLNSQILAKIYQTVLAEIAKDDFRVLEHRIALTPLRKYWIAWRTRRGEMRLHRKERTRGSL